MHGGFGNAACVGRIAHAPVGCCLRFVADTAPQQRGNRLILDTARPTWTESIIQTGQPTFYKRSPPFAHGRIGPLQPRRDVRVAGAVGGPEHNLGTGNDRVWQDARTSQTAELNALVFTKNKLGPGAADGVVPRRAKSSPMLRMTGQTDH